MSTDAEQRLKEIEERNRTYQEVADKSAHDIAREDRAFLLALVRKYREALEEINTCYVDRFGGKALGLGSGKSLDEPCHIARVALAFNPERPSHE